MFFQKGNTGDPLEYPLNSIPPDPGDSQLVSPRVGHNPAKLDPPSMPGSPEYEAELFEVLRVRNDVLNGVWPDWFLHRHDVDPVPTEVIAPHVTDEHGILHPEWAADLVHMDSPIDLGLTLIDWLTENGYRLKDAPPHKPFLATIPGVIREIAEAVDVALEAAFETKYFFGRPRPEEVVGFNCTGYEEGCPCHPADPAGHGAAAEATVIVVRRRFVLDDHAEHVVTQSGRQWRHFRTFAGVHTASENDRGALVAEVVLGDDCDD